MENKPKKRRPTRDDDPVSRADAVRFLLNTINATIYASGDDYESALEEFFPQVQALGHLIRASGLDDVSAFLRLRSNWW